MLKQSCTEHQAQSVEGAVPWGQLKQHIWTKHTVGESFSFPFAHDRTKTLPKEALIMREIAQFSTCFKRNLVAN